MNKAQILILLILIALVVYYFSQEKSVQKPSSQSVLPPKSSVLPTSLPIKPFILPNKPPLINCPPARTVSYEYEPAAQPLSPVLPSEIIEKNNQSTIIMPLNMPAPMPVYHFPSAEFIEINPDEQYRQTMLALLADWLESFPNLQQKSKISQAISLLQAKNKTRCEYLQAIWSLRAMEGFEFYCGQSFTEWVNLPVKAKPADEPLDTGWLTDDNLEFILRNSPRIQGALKQRNQAGKVFHLRTDIANVYNAFYQAKNKQTWDLAEFLQELEWNKAQYTLFPLRVNGNHWGLFILSEREEAVPKEKFPFDPNMLYCPATEEVELVKEVWYTSSGGESLEEEKKQLQPFIEQICGEGTEIKVILPADRESKGYECGVYLVKYVEEILETGALELKRTYSADECQEFRWEWKERIGEGWCLW